MSGPPSDRPSPPSFPRVCGCGARYDERAWAELPSRGTQPSLPGHALELRVCTACGSTLSVEQPEAP